MLASTNQTLLLSQRASTVTPLPGSQSSFGFGPDTLIDGVYRVVGTLGRGGMGVVLRARDEKLERDVAIKLIRPDLLTDDLRARFLSEARAMARVTHPNVLPIYAFGEHEGAPYLVTKIVIGQTVEEWIRKRPAGSSPDLERALDILEGTCRGVAAIHAAETVHRDLKPSNLLLDEEGTVYVADMGVSVLRESLVSERKSGEMVGTPHYMAPELVLEEGVDPALVHSADVYALGCLAYELLTGSPPFAGKTMVACMLAHIHEMPPLPSARRSDLPPGIDTAIFSALAKKPEERVPSADAFRRAIAATRDKTPGPVRILFAEDDEDFRALFVGELQRDFPDAVIDSVENGKAALESFEACAPSVVILDLAMPEMDGVRVIERIRARGVDADVPIIVLTGSGGAREWKQLSELGANGFLVKPVNARDVAPLVNRVLADRARSAEMMPSLSPPAIYSAPSSAMDSIPKT